MRKEPPLLGAVRFARGRVSLAAGKFVLSAGGNRRGQIWLCVQAGVARRGFAGQFAVLF